MLFADFLLSIVFKFSLDIEKNETSEAETSADKNKSINNKTNSAKISMVRGTIGIPAEIDGHKFDTSSNYSLKLFKMVNRPVPQLQVGWLHLMVFLRLQEVHE